MIPCPSRSSTPRDFSTEKWLLGGIEQVVNAEFDAIFVTVLLRRSEKHRLASSVNARIDEWPEFTRHALCRLV